MSNYHQPIQQMQYQQQMKAHNPYTLANMYNGQPIDQMQHNRGTYHSLSHQNMNHNYQYMNFVYQNGHSHQYHNQNTAGINGHLPANAQYTDNFAPITLQTTQSQQSTSKAPSSSWINDWK